MSKDLDKKALDKWIFERTSCKSGSVLVDILKSMLRFLLLLVLFPIILVRKNDFELVDLISNQNSPRCLVRTSNHERVRNLINNTLLGFSVSDLRTNRVFCNPDFKRAFTIIMSSLRHDNYPLDRMAEVHDFKQYKDLSGDFEFFAASDGATPLERTICHAFNMFDKPTIRIVPVINDPEPDDNFNYNCILESFSGEIAVGWVVVRGSPWIKASHSQKQKGVIGVIGSPNGVRLFGLEYWMLIFTTKIRHDSYKVKIRLHPQSYKFSNYLINKMFKIDTSFNEVDSEFIASCVCLISSYRSSLVDLALSSGALVILDKQAEPLSTDGRHKAIIFADLKNPNLDMLAYVRSKLDNHIFIDSHVEGSFPSVLEAVSD
jgi:hypothetical protein